MRLEIADTTPVSPRDLARIGLERRQKLMGISPPKPPKPVRLNAPRPITVLAEQVTLNHGQTGWTFGHYHFIAVEPVTFDSGRITVHRVVEIVAKFFGLSVNDMRSHVRSRQLVYARHIAMYLAREMTPKSLPIIGRELGGRDHTTVMHGHQKIRRLIATDEVLRRDVETLRLKVEGV
jgi:nitric oxide reductase activation protein